MTEPVETTAATTEPTDAPAGTGFYCPACGARFDGPGFCDNQHPPTALKQLDATAAADDGEAAPPETDTPTEPVKPVEPAPDTPAEPTDPTPAEPAPTEPAPIADVAELRAAFSELHQAAVSLREQIETLGARIGL